MKIKSELFQYVRPQSPKEIRLKAANADVVLKPDDLVTALFILAHDQDPEIAGAARSSLSSLPEATLVVALSGEMEPRIIKAIVRAHRDKAAVLAMAVVNPLSDDDTLEYMAANGPATVVEIIATGERLLQSPKLLDILKTNPNARASAIEHAAIRLGAPVEAEPVVDPDELQPEPLVVEDGDMPTAEELDAVDESKFPKELVAEDAQLTENDSKNLYQRVQGMTVAEKVKLAMKGNKEARELLIKQTNKVVSKCVIRNPRITDEEIIRLTQSKSTSDELLREIARNDEWVENYHVKKGLVFNSKTPVPIALKLLINLTERDLRDIARSKNVPGVISSAARRSVDQKAKK